MKFLKAHRENLFLRVKLCARRRSTMRILFHAAGFALMAMTVIITAIVIGAITYFLFQSLVQHRRAFHRPG
jgi:hypothetical protein